MRFRSVHSFENNKMNQKIVIVIILSLLLVFVQGQQDFNTKLINSLLSNQQGGILVPSVLALLSQRPPFSNISRFISKLPDSECTRQFSKIGEALGEKQVWALKMVDATAKPQTGLLHGNLMHVGDYDECIKVDAVYEDARIQGKYCTVLLRPHEINGKDIKNALMSLMGEKTEMEEDNFLLNLRRSIGVCLPAACDAMSLQLMSNSFVDTVKSPIHFDYIESNCVTKEPLPLSTSAVVTITIFAGFAIVIVLSTLYDVFVVQKQRKKKSSSIGIAFSVYTNTMKLLSTKTSEDSLGCLNGIRVISAMWVILGHRLMFNFFLPTTNTFDLVEWKDTTSNAFFLAAPMAVDSFFVVSGLLTVYSFSKNFKRGQPFSYPTFVSHRLLRLTPSLAMIVLLYTTLIQHLGRGPFWPVVHEYFQRPCEVYWWSTLLYIQNYVNPNYECVSQTWYLAVDTQLHLLAPLFLIPMIKFPKHTIISMIFLSVLSSAYIFEVTIRKNFGSVFFDETSDIFETLYIPTHLRFSTFFIGGICGYIIFQIKSWKPIRLSRFIALVLWWLSISVMVMIILCHIFFAKYELGVVSSAAFNALSKPAWAIALCTIILLCITGHGGLVNAVLSHGVFVVLIRLVYNMYLLHVLVLIFFATQQRTPFFNSNQLTFHQFWGDLVFTIFAAAIWCLAFEFPIANIVVALQKKRFVKQENNNGRKISENKGAFAGVSVENSTYTNNLSLANGLINEGFTNKGE